MQANELQWNHSFLLANAILAADMKMQNGLLCV